MVGEVTDTPLVGSAVGIASTRVELVGVAVGAAGALHAANRNAKRIKYVFRIVVSQADFRSFANFGSLRGYFSVCTKPLTNHCCISTTTSTGGNSASTVLE